MFTMFTEAKVEVVSFLAKKYFDRKPRVVLEEINGATLGSAETLDKEQGKYQDAANHYYYVYLNSEELPVRARALLGCVQQLINLGSYPQALRFLDTRSGYISDRLSFNDQTIFNAEIEGKKGWISDYMLNYRGSARHFSEAAEILLKIPRAQWNPDAKELYSTTRHFLGRACYGLAFFGINKKEKIAEAVEYFAQAYRLDREYEGIDVNAKLGFGQAWLARCCILDGDSALTDHYATNALDYFEQQLVITPENKDSSAHGELLQGERVLRFETAASARRHFLEALRVRQNEAPYPRGEADAYLGIALSYKKEWNIPQFIHYANLGRQTHVGALKRLLGG